MSTHAKFGDAAFRSLGRVHTHTVHAAVNITATFLGYLSIQKLVQDLGLEKDIPVQL